MKTEKPKFLKQPGSQRLPFQSHEEVTGAASGNRGHDEVAIAGIYVARPLSSAPGYSNEVVYKFKQIMKLFSSLTLYM